MALPAWKKVLVVLERARGELAVRVAALQVERYARSCGRGCGQSSGEENAERSGEE